MTPPSKGGILFDFVIYVCSYGQTCDETAKCIDNIHKNLPYRFEPRWVTRDALIGRSRSRAASQFLFCDDAPFMIFIDGDIIFSPADIEMMYRSLQAGYEVIGGVYSVADGSFVPAQAFKPLPFDGQIHEMRYISTGFMGISRKALKKIRNDLNLPHLHMGEWCENWPFFESGGLPKEKIYISEDWDFCNKARAVGIKVWLHTGIQVGHLKVRVIPAQEAIQAMISRGQQGAQPVTAECLAQTTLINDLNDYLGTPREDFLTELRGNPAAKHAEEWKGWKGTTEDFYRTNKTQMYDLAIFNNQTAYWQDRVSPLGPERNKKILDFGCGLGTTALFLAQNRNEVVGYDLNAEMIKFANFRKKRFGLTSVTYTTQRPKDLSQFDLVIAIDVLEHIEDLHSLLLELGAGMKSEARLYHCDVFGDQHTHPMHFDHSAHINEWLKEAGFIVWDNRFAVKK